jgi:hypothetical protein
MRLAAAPADDQCMTGMRRLVVELELVIGEQQPIEGWARAPGFVPRSFSGWSEMFATLQTLVSGGQAGGGSAGATAPGWLAASQ